MPTPRSEKSFEGPQRCSVRTVWAPFMGAARVAGVTPGGMGTLYAVEQVRDEQGALHWMPTAFLQHLCKDHDERARDAGKALDQPLLPRKWPAWLRAIERPSMQEWEQRLNHAGRLRPWVEQGVSLTLPAGLDADTLGRLIQRAWWMGLGGIRFAIPEEDEEGEEGDEREDEGGAEDAQSH